MIPKELGEHIDTKVVRRLVHGLHAALLLAVLSAAAAAITETNAFAVPIGSRTLSLSSAVAGAVANHDFSLTLNSAVLIGSFSFEYCQESPLFDASCSPPVGLDLSTATLGAQSGETGFSVHPSTTSSKIILSRASSIAAPGVSTYDLNGVINPSQSNSSAFVRIATYASNDASGPRIDEGGLAFAITNSLNIAADIPPYLILCTGLIVSVNCSSSDGNSINLGELSSLVTAAATSQFAIATNDEAGYNAFIIGSTMTSGIHEISPNSSPTTSNPGSGQFGFNLVANSNPVVGDARAGGGSGVINNSYDDTDLFKFSSGDLIASSSVSTDFNRFTLAYVVNVTPNQSPGLYSTTLTVLGVANF